MVTSPSQVPTSSDQQQERRGKGIAGEKREEEGGKGGGEDEPFLQGVIVLKPKSTPGSLQASYVCDSLYSAKS